MIALLLAMQAAGMVVDYMGTKRQQNFADYGAKLQQAGVELNVEQNRVEAEDSSLQSLVNLRKNMGTQLAVYSARGTNTGQGSAATMINENLANFNTDERMRRMNFMGRESTIKSGGSIYKLNQEAEKSKLWQGFAQRTFNNLPIGSFLSSKGSGSSFGLTQMGGS